MDKILRARREFPYALTNTSCLEYKGDQCTGGYKIEIYDLLDDNNRRMLNDVDFICNIAGRRFKVDIERPVFKRLWEVKHCSKWDLLKVFCKVESGEDIVPFDPWEFVVAADTKCFNKRKYPFSW